MKSALSKLGARIEEPAISWLMKAALDRPNLISLAAGFTDNPSLPVGETIELLEGIFAEPGLARSALQYGTAAGDRRLREMTAERLRAGDGKSESDAQVYSPDHILITNGSQQLLHLVTECLCDTGDIVLVEDPTYFVYLGIAQSRGLECRGVRLTEEGIDLEHLERVLESLKQSGDLRRVKMLYLVSYYQNPTGITSRFDRKAGALELLRRYERAAGHPIYLLEDSAYRELRFSGEAVPSLLAAEGASNRVIYAGTYTKPFATGMRVGFGLMPQEIFKVVLRVKGNHDFGTSNLLQQVLARALASGAYDRHLPELRRRYARKAAVMQNALKRHFAGGIDWVEPHGGLYVWARLPKGVKTGMNSRLFKHALANDVLYVPGELCYCDDPTRRKPSSEMRLSFGSARETKIRTGIERLAVAVRGDD